MILGATLPEAIGGTLSAVYLLLTFVALAFYARRRHKRRARAGRVATLSQTQDIRHWT
jgi:cbb3-type cytochrome oxidase subunit 3